MKKKTQKPAPGQYSRYCQSVSESKGSSLSLGSIESATHKETKIRTSVTLFFLLTQTPETRLVFYHEVAVIMQTLQHKLLQKVKLANLFSTD